MLACLIERGVNKASRAIAQRDDPAVDRDAIHMHIEDVHENAEPRPRLRTHAELGWRNGINDRKQLSIRRTDDQTLAFRRDALWITEEGEAPHRDRRESEGGPGGKNKQQEIEREKQRNIVTAVAMTGNT